ncbi:MAG: type II toxin-antitoxin system HicB family antitoxin [Candidatus Cryptobacteroides sp.]
MNTLKYKGYLGSVAFSEGDGVFFGKIEGIDGLVNFEGKSVQELTDAFHEAVDDYLAYCLDNGIEPRKSYSGTLNIRISPETHTRIAELATEAGVTINTFISKALDRETARPEGVLNDLVVGYGKRRK